MELPDFSIVAERIAPPTGDLRAVASALEIPDKKPMG